MNSDRILEIAISIDKNFEQDRDRQVELEKVRDELKESKINSANDRATYTNEKDEMNRRWEEKYKNETSKNEKLIADMEFDFDSRLREIQSKHEIDQNNLRQELENEKMNNTKFEKTKVNQISAYIIKIKSNHF